MVLLILWTTGLVFWVAFLLYMMFTLPPEDISKIEQARLDVEWSKFLDEARSVGVKRRAGKNA